MHTYQVKIRLSGSVSHVTIEARDSAHAKQLVLAQFGGAVTVLETKRVE